MNNMINFEARSKEISNWLQQEFSGIRTGQAAPGLLDSLKVEQYGVKMPINQMATVGVEDARTLRISPWDAGAVKAIETAIREADLGISAVTDSSGLRVIFPELTSERRAQLLKLAKQKHEHARVSVRSARDEAMKEIDADFKAGDISEDDRFTKREKLQIKVEAVNNSLDALLAEKEREVSK